MHALVLLMQLTLMQPQPRMQQPLSRADSTRMRARVDSAIHQFLYDWTGDWMRTQYQHPAPVVGEGFSEDDERMLAVHCHWIGPSMWVKQHAITNSVRAQAACPRFLPPDEADIADERRNIDYGLAPRYRVPMVAERQRLRNVLDSAAQLLPHDIRLAGQRVRFALDAGDVAGAARAALTCDYALVECGLLQGLILYRVGAVASADSAFAVAASRMPPSERCTWNDIGVLLDPDMREKYERMSCADRADFETRFWWLSDPLWIEPGNERRAEHFARRVMIELSAALGDDVRQHFTPALGGDAAIESLVRYGWPTEFYWAGPDVDRNHGVWLETVHALTAPPYVVREYTRTGRLHTVPSSAAFDSPFTATRDSWQLTAPHGDDDWWPREHYARDRSAITELPMGQTVMLRRGDSTRFVWAGELDSAARGRTIEPGRQAVLFESRSVGAVRTVASFALRGGADVIVDAPLAPGRALIGVEVPGDSAHAAARSRYSIDIAPPLTSLHGARAVSDALLFDPGDDETPRAGPEQAIARMYPSTTFRHPKHVGVYWEGYGFASTDTLDLTVRVAREDRPNVFMRTIHVLGIGTSDGYEVGIRWREVPGGSAAIQHVEKGVPFQSRSIVLDVSQLEPGKYLLQLEMSQQGAAVVTSERHFEVR